MSTLLSGRCVLLVEDEYFIADELRRSFESAGATILGPVGRVAEALILVNETARIDGAVLDVNLHDVMIYPVADALRERGVPFVFATGYEKMALPTRFADVCHCEKPVRPQQIAKALFNR